MSKPYVIEPSMDVTTVIAELEHLAGESLDGHGLRIVAGSVRVMFHLGAALYILNLLTDIEMAGFSTENFEIFFD